MIVCGTRALSEWIRDLCQRTGVGRMLPIGKPIKFVSQIVRVLLAVLGLGSLIHEFARVLRAIIHAAACTAAAGRKCEL